MIGYTRQDWQRLKIDLLQIAQGGVAFPGKISDFGQKYQVNGMLRRPSGRPAWVTTVWIVKNSDDFPTLVTVFPGENP